MKLTLSEWAHVSEMVGAVAVVASLIFVGVQLRENSRVVKSATYQAVQDSDLLVISRIVESEDLGEAYITFLSQPERLDLGEMVRVDNFVLMLLRSFENIFEQNRAGILSDDRWISARTVLEGLTKTKGYTCFFALSPNAAAFSGEYADTLGALVARSPFHDRVDECPLTMAMRAPPPSE